MAKRRVRGLVGSFLLCSFAGTSVLAQSLIKQGGEFQVNTYTFNNQLAPSIALDADGDFVVSWTDAVQEINGGNGIRASRFDSAGNRIGGEFQINSYTSSIQHRSSLAMESNGDFVIVWQSFTQAAAGSYSVFGQRFSSNATPLGAEFMVNTFSTSYAFVPKVASDSDGDFVVVWDSLLAQDGSFRGIFGRRFNSSGTAQAVEFQINSHTLQRQRYPSVALDGDGDFIVVWDSAQQDGNGYGIFGQRFNSAGARQGIEFQVNSYTSDSQSRTAVAADADGDFVVVWQSLHQDGVFPNGNLGVFGRRFTSAGVGQATEFQVNVFTANYQRFPAVAMDDSGDFAITWESVNQDGSSLGVYVRRYSGSGVPIGGEVQVNTYITDDQLAATIDWDSDGDFVIAWQSDYQDPGTGVFAQRFSLPPLASLDIDGDGFTEPLTDGLLLVRHFFGFTSGSLINGAVGVNCTRCEAADIAAYINGLGSVLDIDTDFELQALTDGLLVVRFLFGFTSTALTGNAVDPDCTTRCDAATILPYLQTLD